MDTIRHFQRLFTYDDWANREVIAALAALPEPPPRALRLLSHIVAAQWLWFDRLRGHPQRMPVWPDLSLPECREQGAEVSAAWTRFLATRSPQAFIEEVRYTNTKGERWRNTVHDVLQHVVLHSAYHRAQIATVMREAGHPPAYTDFIHAVRTGAVR